MRLFIDYFITNIEANNKINLLFTFNIIIILKYYYKHQYKIK
jgi:hypothetical protein